MVSRSRQLFIVWMMLLAMLVIVHPTPLGSAPTHVAEHLETTYGEVLDTRQIEIAPDVMYTWYNMNTDKGLQKTHFIEFDPMNTFLQLKAGTSHGKVTEFGTLIQMANDIDAPDHRVIGGISGGLYTTSSEMTVGLFVADGRIMNSPSTSDRIAMGLTADGRSLYGQPQIQLSMEIGDSVLSIPHLNQTRSAQELVLYSSDFARSTQTNSTGDEVIFEIESGDLNIGTTLQLKVLETRNNAGDSSLLNPDQLVLSASGEHRAEIAGLQVGDVVELTITAAEGWDDVIVAIGGSDLIVKDGEVQTLAPEGAHPRSAIGTRSDGRIVLFQIDGQQPVFSEGVELSELGQILADIGVENAMNLDGGESSSFIARLPGETTVTVQNSGSVSAEHTNANGLLLVTTAPETGEADRLIVTPQFDRILVGGELPLQVVAIDAFGHKAPFDGDISFEVSRFGSLTGQTFQAGREPGLAEITATAGAGALNGTVTIEVVDEVTSLVFPMMERSVMPNETLQMSVTAVRNGQELKSSMDQFEWEIDGEIGTVSERGLFTATSEAQRTGKIIVKYGTVQTEITIHVRGIPMEG